MLPALINWFTRSIHRQRPFWVGYADPELYFYFDALRILDATPPANIDHPGTLLQIIGAAVAHFTSRTPDTVDLYRSAMNSVSLLLALAGAVVLVRTCLRDLRWWEKAATLALFWAAPAALRYAMIASPESLYFPVAGLAAACIYVFAERPSQRTAVASGLSLGMAIGLKFVFVTWLGAFLIAVLVTSKGALRARSGWLAATLAAATAGFVAATAAAASRYPDMFRWLTALATTSRWYGEGQGAPDFHAQLRSLTTAVLEARTWHLVIGLLILAVIGLTARGHASPSRFLGYFSLLAIGSNYLIAAKGLVPTAAEGFGDTRYRYVLPVGMASCILLTVWFRSVQAHRATSQVTALLVLVLAGRTLLFELDVHRRQISDLARQKALIDRAVGSARRESDVLICSYTPSPSFALRFATYNRRFLHESALGTAAEDYRDTFDRRYLRMIEKRYPGEGHWMPGFPLSLPSGADTWDLFIVPTSLRSDSPAVAGELVDRVAGFDLLRRSDKSPTTP